MAILAPADGARSIGPITPADARPSAGPVENGLPAVSLVTLDNEAMQLGSMLNGRVALVSFWATWCDSCADEFDALNRLDDRAGQGDAMVVGVAVGEPHEKVAEFVKRRGLHYPQLVDEDMKLVDALGQDSLPTTLIVNRAGKVVFKGGALDARALAAFRAALAASGG